MHDEGINEDKYVSSMMRPSKRQNRESYQGVPFGADFVQFDENENMIVKSEFPESKVMTQSQNNLKLDEL